MWPFKKPKRRSPARLGNPEPGLDPHAAAYRLHRIDEIASRTSQTREDAADLADMWLIQTAHVSVAHGPMELVFIPHPIWDDEWLLARTYFKTRSDAIAHVVERGGELLGHANE